MDGNNLTNYSEVLMRGAGKALPLTEDIPTPSGFKKLSTLQQGDFVFDHNGDPTKIIQLHPIEMQNVYRLTFYDGSTVECSGEHKWEYWLANTGSRNKHTITDTIDLMSLVNEAKTTSKIKKYPLIPLVTKEVEFSEYYTEIDPYLLGLLLGDGCITEKANLTVTTVDEQIATYITERYDTSIDGKKGTKAKAVRFKGEDLINLKISLKSLGLYGRTSIDKFIPEHYLINSKEVRYNLLQGLLDTDGTVDKRGDVYFYSISENLVKGVVSLVESLGGVCTVTQKKGKYKDKQGEIITCNTCYIVRIKHKQPEKLFKLQRKRERVTGFQGFYRKLIDVSIHRQVPMRCITVENERGLFLATYRFIVTHNSELLAMLPLAHIKDPSFEGIFFRRSYPELTGSGGLWQKAGKMYPEFNASKNISNLKYIFPTGSNVKFSHMQHEDDKESHRGLQYSFVGFDEIDQFSKDQVIFLLTCLRSEASMDSFCVGTCNPSPDSWILPIIEYYLTPDGNPDPAKVGVIRYYVVVDGDFVFGDSEDYFKENYPETVYVNNRITGESIYIPPKRFTFIAGNIFDNPALIEANPRYLSELQNLPDHERERQLWGNWYARPKGSNYFDRSWLQSVYTLPLDITTCRSWDFAAKEPSEVYKHPDLTTSICVSKSKDGYFYLHGDYIEENHCILDHKRINGGIRKLVGDRDNIVIDQATADGDSIPQILPVDPGAAGLTAYESTAKRLVLEGIIVRKDPMPSNKSKLTRFLPFSSAAQNGLIKVLPHSFGNKETYEYIMKMLEAFDGERSTDTRKDDFPDCIASGFNYITKARSVTTPVLPSLPSIKTKMSTLRDDINE